MKFSQFMSHYEKKLSSENSAKTAVWKLVPGPLVLAKSWAQLLLENIVFEVNYLF